MAGRSLGGLIVGAGQKGVSRLATAKSGYHEVVRTAIQGQQAAEAQDRNHAHAKDIIKRVHKKAGEGTEVRAQIQSGPHNIDIGYTKGGSTKGGNKGKGKGKGPNPTGNKPTGPAALPSNPTRDAQGIRHDQPDHVANGKEMARQGGYGDHPNIFKVEPQAAQAERVAPKELTGPRKALPSSGNAVLDARSGAKERGMGMVDRTNAGKVNNRLSRFEDRELASRRAKLGVSDKETGTSKGATSNMDMKEKWAEVAFKRQGLPKPSTTVAELDAKAAKGEYTPVRGADLARAKYYGLKDPKYQDKK